MSAGRQAKEPLGALEARIGHAFADAELPLADGSEMSMSTTSGRSTPDSAAASSTSSPAANAPIQSMSSG